MNRAKLKKIARELAPEVIENVALMCAGIAIYTVVCSKAHGMYMCRVETSTDDAVYLRSYSGRLLVSKAVSAE